MMTLSEIKQLSVAECIRIINEIWNSIEGEAEAFPQTEVQRQDLERRQDEHRQNPQVCISWEEAKVRILGRTGEERS